MPRISNPYFPAIANTWTQPQKLAGGAGIPGNVGNNPGMHFISFASVGFNPGPNLGWYLTQGGQNPPNSIIFNVAAGGGLYAQNSGGALTGFSAVPSISNPTIVSATIYQNTSNSYQRLIVPCYASTAGTPGTAAVALGTSSTPSTIATEYISGSTSSTSQKVLESCATIPPGWYYSITLSGASFGTITQIQM